MLPVSLLELIKFAFQAILEAVVHIPLMHAHVDPDHALRVKCEPLTPAMWMARHLEYSADVWRFGELRVDQKRTGRHRELRLVFGMLNLGVLWSTASE